MKDAVLHTRVDSQDKLMAEAILKELGLDLSTAVDVYLKQIIKANGLPFPITKEEKMIENIKATMAMEGLYLTDEDVAMLKSYKCDGSESDKKILQDLEKYYKNRRK